MSNSITDGESERSSSLCRPRFVIPSLFLSPGGWGPPESATKFAHSASCWVSWADFLLFWNALQNLHRKNDKKKGKSRILALQNLSKIRPKCFQNRWKNMRFFFNFCLVFVVCCKSQHQKNMRPRSVLLAFHTIQFIALSTHFRSKKPTKNLSKTKSEPF